MLPLLAGALLAGGCFTPSDRPPLVQVSGVVTYRGQPVEGAFVTFFLAEAPREALGTTDSHGRYVLSSFEKSDGAVPGEHRVTIFKPVAPDAAQAKMFVPHRIVTPADARRFLAQFHRSQLPQKYALRETSDLLRTVNAAGPNRHDFDLTD